MIHKPKIIVHPLKDPNGPGNQSPMKQQGFGSKTPMNNSRNANIGQKALSPLQRSGKVLAIKEFKFIF